MGPQQQLSASQESTPMDSVADFSDRGLLQATYALRFIQTQLVELAMNCDYTLQNGLVSLQYVVQLQDNLEKLLHETRSVCSPPSRKPAESDFETISRVSGGSFGSVNLVRHTLSGQTCAMKIIKWQNLTRNSEIGQVMEERDILTFMDSPYIVSLLCSFDTERDYRMVMEYVAGGDCASLLEKWKRFPVDMARLYVAETTMALEYIHSYGILHRDLKPSNLLISSTGHIKMTDFGLAKIGPVQMRGENQPEPIINIVREFPDQETAGTPLYMAPETILSQGYGKPVDWWALGVILYEFLVGETPFDGDTIDDLYSRVVNDDVSWPEGEKELPADARDLISLLLRKDAFIRLGTGGAVEVKRHPFFNDLDLYQEPPYVPELKTEEDTSNFDSRSDLCTDDNEEDLPMPLPDFCSVAFRFRKVYGSPMHVSMSAFKRSLSSKISEEEEESSGYENYVYDYIYDKDVSSDEERALSSSDEDFDYRYYEEEEEFQGEGGNNKFEEDEGFEEEENDGTDEFCEEEDRQSIREKERYTINEEEEQQQQSARQIPPTQRRRRRRRRKRRGGRGRKKAGRGKKRRTGKGSGKKRRWCKRRRRRRRERRKKNRSCSRRRRRRGVRRRR